VERNTRPAGTLSRKPITDFKRPRSTRAKSVPLIIKKAIADERPDLLVTFAGHQGIDVGGAL
jgi:hypothetical protein